MVKSRSMLGVLGFKLKFMDSVKSLVRFVKRFMVSVKGFIGYVKGFKGYVKGFMESVNVIMEAVKELMECMRFNLDRNVSPRERLSDFGSYFPLDWGLLYKVLPGTCATETKVVILLPFYPDQKIKT